MKELTESKHMSSLDISELSGKSHSDLMKAIRKMESAWQEIGQGKFSLTSYTDQQGREQPMYSLSKAQCLYIATKFNDKARAKLVVRWEELERPQKPIDPLSDIDSLAEHTKRPVQVENSKNINGHLIRNWDVETAIRYNREHCKLVTGMEPNEIKRIGKNIGLKSAQRTSAKEVLRNTQPEKAAQMSINDYLVEHGKKLKAAIALTDPCVPLIGELLGLKRLKA